MSNHFNGPTLTTYTLPTVVIGSSVFAFGDPGCRDALCNQIGSYVRRTEVEPKRLLVAFENGVTAAVSFREADYCGPEAIQFSLATDSGYSLSTRFRTSTCEDLPPMGSLQPKPARAPLSDTKSQNNSGRSPSKEEEPARGNQHETHSNPGDYPRIDRVTPNQK